MTDTQDGDALMPWWSSIPSKITHYEDASTTKIRRALGNDDAGRESRVLYDIIVFRQLLSITTLTGDEFLSAWWQIVVCHFILWKNGVHHCNVSPSNLMAYRTLDGRVIGVFNDFDLSSTQDIPSGQERSGTVPFMALDLLTMRAIEGEVEHRYQHDAESLIWVLTWICLCYEGGVFIGKRTRLNAWLRVDAIGCHGKKCSFLISGREHIEPSESHHENWDMAQSCLDAIGSWYGVRPDRRPTLEDHVVFQTWLEDKMVESKRLSRELLDVRM